MLLSNCSVYVTSPLPEKSGILSIPGILFWCCLAHRWRYLLDIWIRCFSQVFACGIMFRTSQWNIQNYRELQFLPRLSLYLCCLLGRHQLILCRRHSVTMSILLVFIQLVLSYGLITKQEGDSLAIDHKCSYRVWRSGKCRPRSSLTLAHKRYFISHIK